MTAQDFNRLLETRFCKVRDVLASKAGEYSSDADRLHNFKGDCGGVETKETPPQVLWGMVRKQIQSVYDMVNGFKAVTPQLIDEKIGDVINYMILLEALFREKL